MYKKHNQIKLNKVSFNYDGKDLLNDVTFSITMGEKIGLIGENGVGKTTLIKVIMGNIKPLTGSVTPINKKYVGYLSQNTTYNKQKTIYQVVTKPIIKVVKALKEYEDIINNKDINSKHNLTKLANLQDFITNNDGWNLQKRVNDILLGLGIKKDLNTKLRKLSGGEIMRVKLASILIGQPSFLILDEPTNHLDINARLWLQNYLNLYPGTLLVVSHDRDFLNKTINKILCLQGGEVKQFSGNYTFFYNQQKLLKQKRHREYQKLLKESRKAKNYYEDAYQNMHKKKKYGEKNSNDVRLLVGGRKDSSQKFHSGKLAKLRQQKTDLNDKLTKAKPPKEIAFKFSVNKSLYGYKGKKLVSLKGCNLAYKDKVVLKNINFNIYFGQRLALFGKNGSGKTTLIKALLKDKSLLVKPSVISNHNLTIGYIDQHQNNLNLNLSVQDNIKKYLKNNVSYTQLRKFLNKFLFNDDFLVKSAAKNLSGGEKTRLSLAIISAQNPDLLILDEPTNNLDIKSIESIVKVLKEFSGAILLVSHDLAFLRDINVDTAYLVKNSSVKQMVNTPNDENGFKQELIYKLNY